MACKRTEVVRVVACAAVGLVVLPGLLIFESPQTDVDRPALRQGARDNRAHVRKGELEGSVIVPPREQDRRRYRGRAYRQRTNRGSPESDGPASSSNESRYRNVIISAHPVSFDTTVQALSEPVTIDQEEASFVPEVTPVTPGTTVEFVNSDPFYHNVFSLTPGARFNIGRRPTGVKVEETIPRMQNEAPGIGVIELHCDIHPQMNAFIVSLDTPYFTRASEDGSYHLTDLPSGTYRVRGFMPHQDIVSYEVDIREGGRVSRPIDLR